MGSDVYTGESLGERIRRLRKERDLSQTDLAKAIGVSFGWISQIEQDKANASPETLTKIATVFKVPIRELLQNEDEQMELVSKLKLIEVLLETSQPSEAESYIQSLEDHPDLSEKDKINLSIFLAECYYQKKRFDDSLAILDPLIHSLESANYHDPYILSAIRNLMGTNFFLKRKFTDALYNYRKAYDYTVRFESVHPLVAKVSFNVAYTLRMMGHINEAEQYLDQSHLTSTVLKDLKQLGKTFFEQGMILSERKDFVRSAECFEQSKTIFQALNLQSFSAIVTDTFASEVTAYVNPQKALLQLFESIEILRSANMLERVVLVHTKIANIKLDLKQYDEAFSYLNMALQLIKEHSFEMLPEAAECYKILAKYYLHRKEFTPSIEHSLRASSVFDIIGLKKDQIDSLYVAVDAYEQSGNSEQAILMLRKCNQLWSQLYEGR